MTALNRKSPNDQHLRSVLMLFRKLDPAAWAKLRDGLEAAYLSRHSTKNSNAHRAYLSRSRRLERFVHPDKVNRLKYLVFSPKLRTRRWESSDKTWEGLEIKIKESGMISDIDSAVERHCTNWFEILRAAHPDHLIYFTIGQADAAERGLSEHVRSEKADWREFEGDGRLDVSNGSHLGGDGTTEWAGCEGVESEGTSSDGQPQVRVDSEDESFEPRGEGLGGSGETGAGSDNTDGKSVHLEMA